MTHEFEYPLYYFAVVLVLSQFKHKPHFQGTFLRTNNNKTSCDFDDPGHFVTAYKGGSTVFSQNITLLSLQ